MQIKHVDRDIRRIAAREGDWHEAAWFRLSEQKHAGLALPRGVYRFELQEDEDRVRVLILMEADEEAGRDA